MKYNNLIWGIILLLTASFFYKKYKINVERDDKFNELNIIKKYLLDDSDSQIIEKLNKIKKPIIWIHIEYDKNSRKWETFGSRNSENLNQDYLFLTLRSIINKCGNDFHIILIDDNTLVKLLDNWNIDMSKLGGIHKENIRYLGLVNILYNYGGILLEPSFIMFKSLKTIYDNVINDKPFVGEFINDSVNSNIMNFYPSLKFIGCKQYCNCMNELKQHIEIIVSNDYTNGSYLEGQINNWLYRQCKENKFNYINGKYLGTRKNDNRKIDLSELISSCYLDIYDEAYCLYIPRKELFRRKVYNWFIYLNIHDVLKSNTNIGKYLLISN